MVRSGSRPLVTTAPQFLFPLLSAAYSLFQPSPQHLLRYGGLAMIEDSNTPLIQTDDHELYRQQIQTVTAALEPLGAIESHLVERIANLEFRLERIATLEIGIYELGRVEFGDFFMDQDEPTRARLIRTKTYLFYQKEFAKLSLQESRLRRYLEKDMNELKALQCHRAPCDTEQNTPAKWPAPWPTGVKASKTQDKNAPIQIPELVVSRPRLPEDPPDMPEVRPGFVALSRQGGYSPYPNETAA